MNIPAGKSPPRAVAPYLPLSLLGDMGQNITAHTVCAATPSTAVLFADH